jgi:hypothetical protein
MCPVSYTANDNAIFEFFPWKLLLWLVDAGYRLRNSLSKRLSYTRLVHLVFQMKEVPCSEVQGSRRPRYVLLVLSKHFALETPFYFDTDWSTARDWHVRTNAANYNVTSYFAVFKLLDVYIFNSFKNTLISFYPLHTTRVSNPGRCKENAK